VNTGGEAKSGTRTLLACPCDYHTGYQDGWEEGTSAGYETGREEGYAAGYHAAMRIVARDFFTATDPLPEGQENTAAPGSQE
jgi:hypothetical protein